MRTVMDSSKRTHEFDVVQADSTVTIRFASGRALWADHVWKTESQLVQVLHTCCRPSLICFDLSQVEFISSPGLALFLKLREHAGRLQHRLRICSPHPNVLEVFQVTRLDELFEFA